MISRVTNVQVNNAFVQQIFEQRAALEQARQQVSTGYKVTHPSDDPARAGTITQAQLTSQRVERHIQRVASATGLLETQESALNQGETIMLRIKEIAVAAANESVSAAGRATMAQEVFQLRESLVSIANSQYRGVYIWGGADDNDPPFDAATYAVPASASDPAHVRYIYDAEAGTDLSRSIQITDTESVQLTTPGDDVWANAISATERLGRALEGYRTDPEDLSTLPTGTGNAFNLPNEYSQQTVAIRAAIDDIENARSNDITNERTSIGSRINRVQRASTVLGEIKINTETARAAIQDVDVFEAASKFSSLQLSLQGLLASGAQINNLSLLNYL